MNARRGASLVSMRLSPQRSRWTAPGMRETANCSAGRTSIRSASSVWSSAGEMSGAMPALVDRHKAPEAIGFLLADVLADFLVELLLRRPGPVLLEFAHHAPARTRNAEDVVVRRRVEIHRNEHVLLQLVG